MEHRRGRCDRRGWHRLLVEPRRPESIRTRENAYWLAVAAVCIGAFMGQLDASIVTVALPTLQRTFDASVGAVTWVGLSYLLVLVATVTAVGRFADMWGRKLLYVYGFAVFVIGSALCGLAPSLGALIAFRVLQAVGAAMLQANSVAIIVIAVPRASLGKAIGIQGAAQAVGLALGPSVGGLLLAAGGWRLIFMVNVPFGVLGVVAGLLLIPRSLHLSERVPFDWKGLALFFPAVVAVLSAISFGNSYGWTSPLDHRDVRPRIHPRGDLRDLGATRPDPMLDLSLFRRARFRWGITSGLLSYLVMFGVLFLVPFYFERGLGIGAARAGLELMMMPLALGIVAPFAGRPADRLGARPLTVGGMSLVAIGLFALGALRPATPGFLGLLALIGVGLGLLHPTEQRGDHGIGARAPIRPGLRRAEHDTRHGHRTRTGPDRARIRPCRRYLIRPRHGGPGLRPHCIFLGLAATGAVALSAIGESAPCSRSVLASGMNPANQRLSARPHRRLARGVGPFHSDLHADYGVHPPRRSSFRQVSTIPTATTPGSDASVIFKTNSETILWEHTCRTIRDGLRDLECAERLVHTA